jgi:hypothetical protein
MKKKMQGITLYQKKKKQVKTMEVIIYINKINKTKK